MAAGVPSADDLPGILRQIARKRAAGESCELCGNRIPEEHPHLADPSTRRLVCSCRACALLFSRQAETRYRLVPERVRLVPDFAISDELWDGLLIPVEMAYFFHSSAAERVVALYPGPAGPTESLLALESWQELEEANPALREMQPDVEGLLVNRVGDRRDYFIAPIDRFYELVGLIRLNWSGLSGGTEVWRAINAFFEQLRERAGSAAGAGRGA